MKSKREKPSRDLDKMTNKIGTKDLDKIRKFINEMQRDEEEKSLKANQTEDVATLQSIPIRKDTRTNLENRVKRLENVVKLHAIYIEAIKRRVRL